MLLLLCLNNKPRPTARHGTTCRRPTHQCHLSLCRRRDGPHPVRQQQYLLCRSRGVMHVRRDVLKPAALAAPQWAPPAACGGLAIQRRAGTGRARFATVGTRPTAGGGWAQERGLGAPRLGSLNSLRCSWRWAHGRPAACGGSGWAHGGLSERVWRAAAAGAASSAKFSCCELDGAFFLGLSNTEGGLGHGPWGSRLFSNTHCGKRSASTAPARLIVIMVMVNARLPDAACVAAIRIRHTRPWGLLLRAEAALDLHAGVSYLLYTAGFLSTVGSRAAPAPQEE